MLSYFKLIFIVSKGINLSIIKIAKKAKATLPINNATLKSTVFSNCIFFNIISPFLCYFSKSIKAPFLFYYLYYKRQILNF